MLSLSTAAAAALDERIRSRDSQSTLGARIQRHTDTRERASRLEGRSAGEVTLSLSPDPLGPSTAVSLESLLPPCLSPPPLESPAAAAVKLRLSSRASKQMSPPLHSFVMITSAGLSLPRLSLLSSLDRSSRGERKERERERKNGKEWRVNGGAKEEGKRETTPCVPRHSSDRRASQALPLDFGRRNRESASNQRKGVDRRLLISW